MIYLLVALGGALGALARFLTTTFFAKHLCAFFPCGTLFVNLFGSFLITLSMSYFLASGTDPLYRYFFVVGFLGAFTTLSSITYDTLLLFKEGYTLLALVNVFSNLFLSLLSGVGGLALGKYLFYK